MTENLLGKSVTYPERYDPAVLVPIPRTAARQLLGLANDNLPFCGADIWNAYELSWLDSKGLPQVARARFVFPFDSNNLIESKSLKLYLNSLNQQSFDYRDEVAACIKQDLSNAADADVDVMVQPFAGMQEVLDAPGGICLDTLEIACEHYQPRTELLKLASSDDRLEAIVDEVLYTDLFRSCCPITGQPDWATVTVCYQGPQISQPGLLQYLVSYRQHNDYHENCVERIFCDIKDQCRPQSLSVEANFLRRGGLDINPVRATDDAMDYVLYPRYNRQ
jgi:7-cyano-7-deazaguanine reductase